MCLLASVFVACDQKRQPVEDVAHPPKAEAVAPPAEKVAPVAPPAEKIAPVARPTEKVEPVARPIEKVEPVARPAEKAEAVARPTETNAVGKHDSPTTSDPSGGKKAVPDSTIPLNKGQGVRATGASGDAPVYRSSAIPAALEQNFVRQSFQRDVQSGNYLGPKLSIKTLHDLLVPILIEGSYVKDLRGQTVFLRQTIRDKLLEADEAMFKRKKEHLKINYGFRSNALQYELYQKLNGHAKVAPAGMSFHETGMAIDLSNWRDAHKYMIEAGFAGGCDGLEEDLVHYSINEINKASNVETFKRCTLKDIPKDILKGAEKVGDFITFGHLPKKKKP
jgi:hypothetical protein